jgi:hypothetical protein
MICNADHVPASDSYLQMLQDNITRMAGQSTTVKGWCVTLTSALLGIGTTTTTPMVAALAIYVIATFAALDAYYLTLERAFRSLYTDAITDASPTWNLTPAKPSAVDLTRALASPATALLYGTSLLVAITFTIEAAAQH